MPHHTEVVPFPGRHRPVHQRTHLPPLRRPLPVGPHPGKRALADRNGTDALMAALPLLRELALVTIYVQHGEHPSLPVTPPHVSV